MSLDVMLGEEGMAFCAAIVDVPLLSEVESSQRPRLERKSYSMCQGCQYLSVAIKPITSKVVNVP